MAIYPATGDRLNAMTKPGGLTERHARWHGRTMDMQENVKAYGAVGDGVADDTSAIQAALDAAGNVGKHVFFPPGTYKITASLTIGSISIRGNSAQITGSLAGALLSKTGGSAQSDSVHIDGMSFNNTHATGTGIALTETNSALIIRCGIVAYTGIVLTPAYFSTTIEACRLVGHGGNVAGGIGISASAHVYMFGLDVVGFEKGITLDTAAVGWNIIGSRIEVCKYGIYIDSVTSGTISGMSLEANDYGIYLRGTNSVTVSDVGIQGSTNAPSGQSLVGIDIVGVTRSTVLIACRERGNHSTAFIRTDNVHYNLLLIGCWDEGSGLSFANYVGVYLIGVRNEADTIQNLIRAGVIATASLPAAAAAQDGRILIEDGGAGNRNLMIYAGGQRFRIDGGAAV